MRSGSLEGFSRYIIYEDGSMWNKLTDSYMSPVWNGGFWCINLTNDSGKKSLEKIHRLVAICFVENPEGYKFVGHIDENKNNNQANNLYWRKGNRANPSKHGNKVGDERLTPDDTQRLQTLCGCSHDNVIKMMRNNLSEEEMYLGGIRFSDLIEYNGSRAWSVAEGQRANGRKMRYEAKKKKQKAAAERSERKAREKEQRETRIRRYKENLLYGVGLFDYWNVGERSKDVEHTWRSMMSRCYSKDTISYSNYGERGVVVCEEWLTYSKYHEWYIKHFPEDTSVKYVIDKDILSGIDREYSPSTCLFIPWDVNHFLRAFAKITLIKRGEKYIFRTRVGGENIEYKGSIEEVVEMWIQSKKDVAISLLSKFPNLPKIVKDVLTDFNPINFSKISRGSFKIIIRDSRGNIIDEINK